MWWRKLLLLLLLSHFSRVRLCDPIDGSPPGPWDSPGKNCYFLSKAREVCLAGNRNNSPWSLWRKGMQVKEEDTEGTAGLNHSLGSPREDLPTRQPNSWLGSVSTRARTPPPRWSLCGTSSKSQEEVSDPGILHSAALIVLHQHSTSGKGVALRSTDARNRGGDVRAQPMARQQGPHLMESETCGVMSTTSLLVVLCCFRDKPRTRAPLA